jgi:hypothetical protein
MSGVDVSKLAGLLRFTVLIDVTGILFMAVVSCGRQPQWQYADVFECKDTIAGGSGGFD